MPKKLEVFRKPNTVAKAVTQPIRSVRTALLRLPPARTKYRASHINKLASGIARMGVIVPIVADENNVILSGGAIYLAAVQLGLPEVPVVCVSRRRFNARQR